MPTRWQQVKEVEARVQANFYNTFCSDEAMEEVVNVFQGEGRAADYPFFCIYYHLKPLPVHVSVVTLEVVFYPLFVVYLSVIDPSLQVSWSSTV